jgi:hypothetical protein
MPAPVVPREPSAPDLASQYPTSIVITKAETEYYTEACDAWESGEYTEDELLVEYSLSRGAACDWAIYGHTVQGSLDIESIFVQQADYVERLRAHIDALVGIINNQYLLSKQTTAAIKD